MKLCGNCDVMFDEETFSGSCPNCMAVERLIYVASGQSADHREGTKDTPGRVIRAIKEMTRGRFEDPAKILERCFETKCDEMVVLRDIEFTSVCEHHLLPFAGVAHVGYVPGECVVGLSKLARLVLCFARRLQIQERLTVEICESLMAHTKARGAGVVVEAHHFCMGCRGVKQPRARMVTSALLGCMREASPRAEFLGLARR